MYSWEYMYTHICREIQNFGETKVPKPGIIVACFDGGSTRMDTLSLSVWGKYPHDVIM